jgi:CRP-like cAMP-binding protein
MSFKINSAHFDSIRNTALFKNVDSDYILSSISTGGFKILSFKKGETILDPNCGDKYIAIVLAGAAEVYKLSPRGKKFILSTLLPRNIFGAITLFSGEEGFVNYIVAKKDMKIAFFEKELIEKLLSENFIFTKNYLSYLSSRIRFLNGKIETISAGTADSKLALFLKEEASERGDSFELAYSMTDLAKLLNIGRESLYRAFSRLEGEKIISRSAKLITVLDPNGLSPYDEGF